MSKTNTLLGMGTRNTFKATGRLIILVLLLASALVARATSDLALAGLCQEAVDSVSTGGLPNGLNTVAYSVATSYDPQTLQSYLRGAYGMSWYTRGDYITGYYTRYFGPGGRLELIRPSNVIAGYRGGTTPTEMQGNWYTSYEGVYPTRPEEVAIPRTLADKTGLALGDTLSLTETETGQAAGFTVTAIYEPAGSGPFYEQLLSVYPPDTPIQVNFIVAQMSPKVVGVLRSWGGPSAAEVVEYVDPKDRMSDLARAVYGTQSSATSLGFTLVGVAVLIVLLVALVERRRESAIYKMVGLNSVATLSVLGIELIWSLLVATVIAAPVYWYVATRYVLDVHAGGLAVIGPPFVVSAAWTVVVAALGACYPFALTSVGTPNQLMTKQKIYLIRRKHVLRGWTSNGA